MIFSGYIPTCRREQYSGDDGVGPYEAQDPLGPRRSGRRSGSLNFRATFQHAGARDDSGDDGVGPYDRRDHGCRGPLRAHGRRGGGRVAEERASHALQGAVGERGGVRELVEVLKRLLEASPTSRLPVRELRLYGRGSREDAELEKHDSSDVPRREGEKGGGLRDVRLRQRPRAPFTSKARPTAPRE